MAGKTMMHLNSGFLNDIGEMSQALLFELPGIRWGTADARAARGRMTGAVLDVLNAFAQDEMWIYVFPGDGAAQTLLSAPHETLRTLLGSKKGEEPAFRARVLHGLKNLGDPDSGVQQPWHYAAQTDIRPDAEVEFNQWFDEEHLPLLADVPGTVCARRYRTDGVPRYLACYDLTTRETHGSAAWRAAASTPWRDRVHENFVNPRRMMFARLL